MASQCPTGFDVQSLREQVKKTYNRVAAQPDGDYHFHRGPNYAIDYLRYDPNELTHIPEISKARFAGVGNPHRVGPILPGQVVLDHACGAGMDLLIAARKLGPDGKAIGVDMTSGMRHCARQAAEEAGLSDRVEILAGFFEELPIDDGSVDILISNGVINLSPDKEKVFSEIHRVLKPGGKIYLSDVVVQRELTLEARSNPDLWAACIGGALPESELIPLTKSVGFKDGVITERFHCFRGTSAETKLSKDLYVQGVNFFCRK